MSSANSTEEIGGAPASAAPVMTVGDYAVRPDPIFRDDYGLVFAGTRQSGIAGSQRAVCWLRYLSRPVGESDADWLRSVEEFRRLIEKCRALNGTPGIQKIVGTVAAGDQAWVAYEPAEGVSLRTFLDTTGRVRSVEWAHGVLRQIGDVLEAAAQKDLIHGDVTLDTLYIKPDGKSITLTNFGLALLRDKFGSPYAPPEQWEGYEGDSRADVFASGAVLYEILFGQPAFPGFRPNEIAARLRTAPPANIPSGSEVARDVLMTMLAHYPTRRYGRVLYAAEDLRLHHTPTGIASVRLPPDPEKTATPTMLTARENRLTSLILADSGDLYSRCVFLERIRPHQSFTEIVAHEVDSRSGTPAGTVKTHVLGRTPMPPPPVVVTSKDDPDRVVEPTVSVPTLIQQIREQRQTRQRQEANAPKRERLRKAIVASVVVAAMAATASAAAALRDAYRYATITEIIGAAGNDYSPAPHSVQAGERLDPTDPSRSAIHTRADSSVLLALHDACVKIGPSTEFEILEMDYPVAGPPVRHFALRQGYVSFAVNPQQKGATFDILCRGIHFSVHGTAFRVSTAGAHGVVVQTAEGAVRAARGDGGTGETAEVSAGSQLAVPDVAASAASSLPATTPFSRAEGASLLNLGRLRPAADGLAAVFENWEAATTIPLIGTISNMVDWNTLLGKLYLDTKNVASAKLALGEIGKMIYTSSDDSVPATLSLTSLSELSLTAEERSTYLACFKDNRLLYYHRLSGNGYEIAAYANDTEKTLIVVRNGKAFLKKGG